MVGKPVVLITGGSDGVGKTIAARLKNRYQVVILSPTPKKVRSVAKNLGCDSVVADVSDYAQISAAVDSVVKKYHRLDCLINSAGLWIQEEVDKTDAAGIARVMQVNSLGLILATKAVIPQMKLQKSGRIININSDSGINAKKERSIYIASKHAVTGFTKSIQPELAHYGIAVTQILPGGMNTDFFTKAGNPKDQTNYLDPGEIAKVVEFILTLPLTTLIMDVGIRNINNF